MFANPALYMFSKYPAFLLKLVSTTLDAQPPGCTESRALCGYKCSGWWFKDTVMIPLTSYVCHQKLFVPESLCFPSSSRDGGQRQHSFIFWLYLFKLMPWLLWWKGLIYLLFLPILLSSGLFWSPTPCGIVLSALTPFVCGNLIYTWKSNQVQRHWGCFKYCADA